MSVKSTWGARDGPGGDDNLFVPAPMNPDACPLGTFETKMAARNAKCSTDDLDELNRKIGHYEQSMALLSIRKYELFV